MLSMLYCQDNSKNSNNDNGKTEHNENSTTTGNDNTEKKEELNFSPIKKDDDSKFKIAVIQSGEFGNYTNSFLGILDGFKELNWVKDIDIPQEKKKNLGEIINTLQSMDYSDYVEFPKEMFFDFNWAENEQELKQKINSEKYQHIIKGDDKADFIISLGTLASTVLSKPDTFDIPILVASVSDPVASDIIKSTEDSGKDYLTAFCDPDRFTRQVKLFYDVVQFDKLAVLYTNTTAGKSYAALEDIKNVAEEKGFDIVSNVDLGIEIIESDKNPDASKVYLDALEKVCEKISNKDNPEEKGAVYLTIQAGLTLESLPKVLEIVNKHKLPSFAMEGSKYVKHGILYSIATIQERLAGKFNAEKIIKVFKGMKPRELNQVFSVTPEISINLKTAEIIGHNVPVDILVSSNETYNSIEEYKSE